MKRHAALLGFFFVCAGGTAWAAPGGGFGTFVGSPAPPGTPQPPDMDVLTPLIPGQPVRLVMNVCQQASAAVSPPVATVSGNDIQVAEPLVAGNGPVACSNYLIDLGELPVGSYQVTATRTYSGTSSTISFGFIVQQPQRTAPCNELQTVTTTPQGGARLRYEGEYYGVAPSFGPPSVTSKGCCNSQSEDITITQPVTDVAGPSRMYHCHGEELDLGPLHDGVYTINWLYTPAASFPGNLRPPAPLTTFRWTNGAMECSNLSDLTTSGSLLADRPFEVVRTQLTWWGSSYASASIAGSVITIDEDMLEEGPIPWGEPVCGSTRVPIGPVPPSDYLVIWNMHFRLAGRVETHMLQLSVTNPSVNPGRRRAARH